MRATLGPSRIQDEGEGKMKNFKIEICKRGIEVLVATVSAEMANGNRISQDIDVA